MRKLTCKKAFSTKNLIYQLKKQIAEEEKEKIYPNSFCQQEERNSSLAVLAREVIGVEEQSNWEDLLNYNDAYRRKHTY